MEIISGQYLVSMDQEPLLDGAIAVEGGEILDVGLEADLLARYPNASHEDHTHHAILPGLINAHTHLDMTHHKNFPFDPVRSLAIEVNFIDWLLSCIEYKKKNSPDRQREAVLEGLDACIESGTTCVADMGSYEGIFQVLEQKGIRSVIFPEVFSYDSAVAKDLFETALGLVEKYTELDSDLISVGIGPYSPYTLSRNVLRIMSQYCKSSGLPLMMHVSESFAEMEFFYNSTGDIATRLFPNIGWGESLPPAFQKTPIQHLDDVDFFECSPILVGCVHATPDDADRMARKKVKVVWCPRSNDYLKLAKLPLSLFLNRGVPVALGTDGIPSTNTLSLWDEMRFAFEITRKIENPPGGKTLLEMVTRNAAQILGLEKDVGSLSVGKKADYIVVDIRELPDTGDLYLNLVQNIRNYHIVKVVVGGRTLKTMN